MCLPSVYCQSHQGLSCPKIMFSSIDISSLNTNILVLVWPLCIITCFYLWTQLWSVYTGVLRKSKLWPRKTFYADERREGTYWENIEHRDQYFPSYKRWQCTYAAYGGFLLYYTVGGTNFCLMLCCSSPKRGLYLILSLIDVHCMPVFPECEIKLPNCPKVTTKWR